MTEKTLYTTEEKIAFIDERLILNIPQSSHCLWQMVTAAQKEEWQEAARHAAHQVEFAQERLQLLQLRAALAADPDSVAIVAADDVKRSPDLVGNA